MFCARNVKSLPIEITPEGYDLEQIECLMRTEKPKLFYMNPTFQNPTGYTVPTNQRKALVELAERYQCILVEDEVYHDIYFGDPPPRLFITIPRAMSFTFEASANMWPLACGYRCWRHVRS